MSHRYQDEKMHGGFDHGPVIVEDRRSGSQKCCKKFIKTYLLPVMLACAMLLGLGMGFLIREVDPSFTKDPRRIMYLNYPGELLLRMLKMCILPLVVASLIDGMASLPSKAAGRIGGLTVLYYLTTTFVAVLLGILLVMTIKPGLREQEITKTSRDKVVHPVDALLDLIRNVFPPNLVEAAFKQTKTEYTMKEVVSSEHFAEFVNGSDHPSFTIPDNDTRHWLNDTHVNSTRMMSDYEIDSFKVTLGGGSNVLGLIAFSICFGLMMGRMGRKAAHIKAWFHTFMLIIIKIVRLIIWYSPIGIAFLLAARIVAMQDPATSFKQLAWYMMTVIVGLLIHAFVILPSLYLVFTRKNPFKLMMNMSQALLTAMGTASSSATLPITLRCLEENAKVDPIIGGFVLPVGATINMDGTALYEAVASIFIAQYNNISLSAGQVVTVSVTATAAAIGAAGVPEAGLVTMVIVLTAVGLPIEDVGLIYAVDWFLDRLRTTVNVWGDSIGAGIIGHNAEKDLERLKKALEAERAEDPPSYNGYGHYVVSGPVPTDTSRL